MNSEWKEFKIGDIVSVRRGSSPRPIKNFICSNGIPWVKIADATSINSRFIDSTKEFIKLEGVKNSVIVNPGDLIVSNSATPGLPKFMNIKACVHDGWLIFDNYNGILKEYLYYYFVFIRKNLVNQANGTIFKNLKTDIVKNFVINLPNLHTQKRIVKILSNIDNDIELNNKLNQNLEKLCVAQFKQNFLLRKPFEDELMKDSSLGEIPKSWNVVSIVDFVDEMKNGGTPRRGNEEYWVDGDIPWLKTKEVDNSIIVNSEEFITKKGLKNSSAKLLPINTVIMALYGKGTAGRVGLLKFEATTNQACCAMICNNPNKAIYLYLYLLINQKKIESFANGSVQQNLSKDILKNFEIIVPPDNIINNANFNLIFNKIKNNIKENQNLTQIRDTLLPKLMSGEIDVSKIEVE